MNRQQQAQAHKCEYKARAIMRKFSRRYGNNDGAVVIEVPESSNSAWVQALDLSLSDRQRIIAEADRLTGGKFSEVMMGQPHYEGQPTIEAFRQGVTIIDPLDPPFPQRDYLYLLQNPELTPEPETLKMWNDTFTNPKK